MSTKNAEDIMNPCTSFNGLNDFDQEGSDSLSVLSLKSDRSMQMPIHLSNKTHLPHLSLLDRSDSSGPSVLSMKSDRSMQMPIHLKNGSAPMEKSFAVSLQQDRSDSSAPSFLSMKSNRSMQMPIHLNGSPPLTLRGLLTKSCQDAVKTGSFHGEFIHQIEEWFSNQPDKHDNQLGHDKFISLTAGLQDTECRLESLNLETCGVTKAGCVYLSKALSSNPSHLRVLDLSWNDIGDSGVKHLCASLVKMQCALETLRLNNCNITYESCIALAKILQIPSSLKELSLSKNKLQDSGVMLFSVGLHHPHCKLKTLRSFPGFFKNTGKNKRHLARSHRPIVPAKAQKTFDVSVSLLGSKSDTTPSISEELELMQAGLGKRTLSLTWDTTHAELSSLLQEAYSKMSDLEDRWLLFKAAGGNGRRRISVIPLEAEGYKGSVIKSASGGGKNLLYIVPLQDELDMTPLPPDAPEFARMPKATCKKCKTLMPLQTLALHSDQCDSVQNSENSEIEALEAQCPICTKTFPVSELELHASFCGESLDGVPEKLPEEDVIRHAAAQINIFKIFEVCVSRDNILERGLKLWKRQKTGSPVNPLKITFLGEPGVDTGALRKEFLSSDAKKGKMPKVAGEIFAVSIAQGGPAPRFMQEWCYEYLVSGNIKRDGVHDTEISPLIKMIEDASDLSNYTKEILDCGYTGPVNVDHKESILRALALHITTKRIPMLQQLREGLEIYDLIKVMQRKPHECHDLFVIGYDDKVDAHYILSHLAPEMSPSGSIKQVKESKIMEFFQDFLLELEGMDLK
ncbi:hypothetical protein G5714_015393 [Onychostoma macrolepis]|uniref:HECT domain-containing protein n=1 Tax=Onychostoma macrolepis TaxID=369639 RepID=A0A7J6CB40_9TELE|nr:hypothetical protein G5714_015393 [Onychostoma macrolepis]